MWHIVIVKPNQGKKMQDIQDIEIEVEGGVVAGNVEVEFGIEDNSFDHEFGTEYQFDTILSDEEIGIDDLRFFPYENDDENGLELTASQQEEVRHLIPSKLSYPSVTEVRDAMDDRF